jgi:hypothetical protein
MTPTSDFDHIFEAPKVCHTLEVMDERLTTFRSNHEITIKAVLRSRFYLRRFIWTGSEGDDVPELLSDFDHWGHPIQKVHGPVIKDGEWRLIVVDLGTTMEIGEVGVLKFKHHLRDLEGTFQRFLAHRPKTGTQMVDLQVILPRSISASVTGNCISDTGKVLYSKNLEPVSEYAGKPVFRYVVAEEMQPNRKYQIAW